MIKKIIAIVAIILTALLIFQLMNKEGSKKTKDDPPLSQDEPTHEDHNIPSTEELITEILNLAKEGKVLHTPFIAGQTNIEDIKNSWGEPENIEIAGSGKYANYLNHDVTIGFQNSLVFDIRSYHSELQEIHLQDIKKVQGEPDDITYYKDDFFNQIIMMYHLNGDYQIKWVMPKPTDSEPNPAVHHISIFTQIPTDPSDLINNRTLDEKIGQMIFPGISGTSPNEKMADLINKYKVGGIILNGGGLVSPEQTINYLNEVKSQNANNPIPILFGVDQEGGRISKLPGNLTKLPTNQTIGIRNDPSFSNQIGTILGKELKAFGFNIDFAPVLDVNSNPNNPVIGDRSFGNNPDIVSRLGIQTMKGIQSQNVISVIKHFPGHGDTSVDSHKELPVVNKSLKELESLELIPFKHAIEEGADVVMVGHILLPKLDASYPATMSKPIINGILREKLHFNGVIITDDMTMNAITNQHDIGQAAVQSVKAGSDIIMVAHDYDKIVSTIQALKAAVENGDIPVERIDESVSRILELKKKYKINNEKVKSVDIEELNQLIGNVLD